MEQAETSDVEACLLSDSHLKHDGTLFPLPKITKKGKALCHPCHHKPTQGSQRIKKEERTTTSSASLVSEDLTHAQTRLQLARLFY